MKHDPSVKYEEKVFNLSNGNICHEIRKAIGTQKTRILQTVIRAEDLITIGWTPPGKDVIKPPGGLSTFIDDLRKKIIELEKEIHEVMIDNEELKKTIQENNAELQKLKKAPAPIKLLEEIGELNEVNRNLREDVSTLNETLTRTQAKYSRFLLTMIDMIRQVHQEKPYKIMEPSGVPADSRITDEEIDALTAPAKPFPVDSQCPG